MEESHKTVKEKDNHPLDLNNHISNSNGRFPVTSTLITGWVIISINYASALYTPFQSICYVLKDLHEIPLSV